ncbi:hypothetical protein [Flavobacterium johnsoniae]|jgi:hypothetical protein|uniref:Uncharacterized protein n=1 Tax=Flavobacterium johnsoniae TaxID=986 RepID=A0A1J7BSB2_FLAJO|nr:hypothetical protein [Flavobacterium johnsoniae]OIV41599.1 hypothetical protein BKM63_13805 [Flavobacterium johnsoniae]
MKSFKIIGVILVIQIFINCDKKEKFTIDEPEKTLLKYTVFEEKVTDNPIKTQILTDIIINKNDSITTDKIEVLLKQLYQERINRTDFQYRENPNSVAVYAYLSKERAESGAGQWIAMIAKMPIDSEFKITFNEFAINSLDEKEITKWNLSYEQRKMIWDKMIFAERDSQSEADNRYPLVPGLTKEDLIKNSKLAEKLKVKKEEKIIKDYKITRITLDSISLEGLSNDWEFPKRK